MRTGERLQAVHLAKDEIGVLGLLFPGAVIPVVEPGHLPTHPLGTLGPTVVQDRCATAYHARLVVGNHETLCVADAACTNAVADDPHLVPVPVVRRCDDAERSVEVRVAEQQSLHVRIVAQLLARPPDDWQIELMDELVSLQVEAPGAAAHGQCLVGLFREHVAAGVPGSVPDGIHDADFRTVDRRNQIARTVVARAHGHDVLVHDGQYRANRLDDGVAHQHCIPDHREPGNQDVTGATHHRIRRVARACRICCIWHRANVSRC